MRRNGRALAAVTDVSNPWDAVQAVTITLHDHTPTAETSFRFTGLSIPQPGHTLTTHDAIADLRAAMDTDYENVTPTPTADGTDYAYDFTGDTLPTIRRLIEDDQAAQADDTRRRLTH